MHTGFIAFICKWRKRRTSGCSQGVWIYAHELSIAGPENLIYFFITSSYRQETETFHDPLYGKLQFSKQRHSKTTASHPRYSQKRSSVNLNQNQSQNIFLIPRGKLFLFQCSVQSRNRNTTRAIQETEEELTKQIFKKTADIQIKLT